MEKIKEKQKKQDEEERQLSELQLIELSHQYEFQQEQVFSFEDIDYVDEEKDKGDGYPGKW